MNKPHVLVVDDNLTVSKLAVMVLKKGGYTVTAAGSGREALGMISEGLRPDILLLDHSLPDMQGDQLLESLPLEQRQRLRVLLTTGYDSQALRAQYPQDLPVQTLQKPWDAGDLLQAISALEET